LINQVIISPDCNLLPKNSIIMLTIPISISVLIASVLTLNAGCFLLTATAVPGKNAVQSQTAQQFR